MSLKFVVGMTFKRDCDQRTDRSRSKRVAWKESEKKDVGQQESSSEKEKMRAKRESHREKRGKAKKREEGRYV